MSDHMVIGIYVTDRMGKAGEVQSILTKYGCNIRSRIGLHDVHDDVCSNEGLILLQVHGEVSDCNKIVSELKKIKGIEVQKMIF